MMKDFTIQPLKGYGEIPFGMTLDEAVKLLNMPDFYEELNDMEETGNRSIYYEYAGIQTNIYFEGITKSVVACFETENEAATLYGKKVFGLKKDEVVKLMKDNGFKDMEEEEEDGELRVSFEDAMIDFFFEGDKMTAVSWGVLVDEQGDII
ncbi:MAG: hypothetical protein IKD78_12775 [Bacteroidales bacterium]|nr:hypothetical protein [Bacteroidales bacterium]MBR6929959.1 hypothetical protein [Bacteroidales bacterium]